MSVVVLKQLLGGLDLLDMMHASGSILIVLNPVIGTEHELKHKNISYQLMVYVAQPFFKPVLIVHF